MDRQAQAEITSKASGDDLADIFQEERDLSNMWSPLVDPWWSWGFGGGLFKVRDPGR
jgi:hypothetical protein